MKKLIVGVSMWIMVALTLPGIPPSLNGYAQSVTASTDSAEASVVLSVTQIDSILDVYDELRQDIDLLKIDLWEQRQYSRLDSLEISTLRQQLRHQWWQRILYNPAIWFMVGAYIGLNAGEI